MFQLVSHANFSALLLSDDVLARADEWEEVDEQGAKDAEREEVEEYAVTRK